MCCRLDSKTPLGLSQYYVHIFYYVRDILASDAYGIDHYNMIIQSLVCMVHWLMSLYTTSLLEIENYITCFLQSVNNFETHICVFASYIDIVQLKQGNFVSLFNLYYQIKSLCSTMWYWYGSREKFIERCKTVYVKYERYKLIF